MKSVDHLVREVEMTADLMTEVASAFSKRFSKIRIWEQGGQTVAYCDQCQRVRPIDKKTLREVRASQICPWCFRPIHGTTEKAEYYYFIYVSEEKEDDAAGYRLNWDFDHGNFKKVHADQVAYWNDGKEYVRGIILGMMGGICQSAYNYWRKVRANYYSTTPYHSNMYSAEDLAKETEDGIIDEYDIMAPTKKDFYHWIASNEQPLKTNQIHFIKEGLYNQQQIRYIKAFDLKTREQVLKASGYIKKNYIDDLSQTYTPATLDYLRKNKIRLSDYQDYERICRLIGRKPDRPKDFRYWHDEVMKLYKAKKDEMLGAIMAERAKSLPGYKKQNIVIRSIETPEELAAIGQTLHNCIRTYLERYAEGKCDLYTVIENGAYIGAIETRDGRVIQARGDHNEVLQGKPRKTVATWAKERKLQYDA